MGSARGGGILTVGEFLLARLYNWHRIDAALFRSAQMYRGHSRTLLAAHGIATVVNLRGANPGTHWYQAERDACADLGIEHVDCALHSRRLPARQRLLALLTVYETAARPMLLKCSGGADRSAFAAALYLLHRDGPGARAAALRQMRVLPYLHIPGGHQRWIRRFPEFLCDDAADGDIAAWVRERYEPERFADWLGARNLGTAWRR